MKCSIRSNSEIIFLWIIFLILPLLLTTCGKGKKLSSDTGALTFHVAWEDNTRTAAASMKAPLDCAATGVASVEAAVYDQGNYLLAKGGPWACVTHQGEITNVPAGENRTIVIVAKDVAGNIVYQGEKTGISVIAGQTISAGEIVASSFKPVITNCIAGDGQTTLNWGIVEGARSYNLYWSVSSGVTKSVNSGAISSITGTTYTHTGRANGTAYYYVVTAVNAYGESAVSGELNAKPGTLPSAPTNIRTTTGSRQNTIRWDIVGGAESYNLYWSVLSGVSKTAHNGLISGITATACTHSALTVGTTYYYVVTAANAFGESGESGEVHATSVALSSNADLMSLVISGYHAMEPSFNSVVTAYEALVEDMQSVTVTPTAADGGATITVNGAACASGQLSQAVALTPQANRISIIVIAADTTTTKTYTITVVRNCILAPGCQDGSCICY